MQIMAVLRFLTCPLNPEHRNCETQFVSLAPKLNSKWLNGLLHVLRKYIYDLFNVFRRKWLNLLYTVTIQLKKRVICQKHTSKSSPINSF